MKNNPSRRNFLSQGCTSLSAVWVSAHFPALLSAARHARETARKAATDMVSNVTNWVNEFQQKQSIETAKAVETLIRSRQQPNEA